MIDTLQKAFSDASPARGRRTECRSRARQGAPRADLRRGHRGRWRALVRRGREPLLPERLTVGPLAMDTRSRRVRVHDKDVSLTAKEYALLEYLVRRAGDVVGRGDIAEHVWDEHYDPVSNVVDVYVQRLRRKLDRVGCDSLIRTRRGEGYQLVSSTDAP